MIKKYLPLFFSFLSFSILHLQADPIKNFLEALQHQALQQETQEWARSWSEWKQKYTQKRSQELDSFLTQQQNFIKSHVVDNHVAIKEIVKHYISLYVAFLENEYPDFNIFHHCLIAILPSLDDFNFSFSFKIVEDCCKSENKQIPLLTFYLKSLDNKKNKDKEINTFKITLEIFHELAETDKINWRILKAYESLKNVYSASMMESNNSSLSGETFDSKS